MHNVIEKTNIKASYRKEKEGKNNRKPCEEKK